MTSSQTLASVPFSICAFSASSKILPAPNNSSLELLSVASSIGASGSTSASFSRLALSSVVPVIGIITTFFWPQSSLSQRVSFFPSSVAVASLVIVHSPVQSCPNAAIFTASAVVVVVPFASVNKLSQPEHV